MLLGTVTDHLKSWESKTHGNLGLRIHVVRLHSKNGNVMHIIRGGTQAQ
jgi:hypothetical protein